ncbi:MAG: TlpA family protein disulfide reductase, partial [Phycisphaerales bacterium]|nr:TlpA family protein disulfide reductase [Phycisphaerales bacterium]
ATWCGPCRAALPHLHETAAWADEQGMPVKVFTVNVWERSENPEERRKVAETFWKDQGFTLPVLMDYSNETATAFGVTAIPTTVVIRSDGVIHAQHSGFNGDQLRADITAALATLEKPEQPADTP